jgi:hypothetical protein
LKIGEAHPYISEDTIWLVCVSTCSKPLIGHKIYEYFLADRKQDVRVSMVSLTSPPLHDKPPFAFISECAVDL